jgi:23S rRNA pseudouridine2605 synthase
MSPDTPDVTPLNASADASAPVPEGVEGAAPAPKRARAPRKTAVKAEAADGADAAPQESAPAEAAADAAPAPRKRTRKAIEASDDAPAEPSAAADVAADAAPVAAEARATRAPRARRPVESEDVATAEAASTPERGGDVAPSASSSDAAPVRGDDPAGDAQGAAGGENGEGDAGAPAGDGEGRRSRSRRRRRGRRGGSDDVAADGAPRAEGADDDEDAASTDAANDEGQRDGEDGDAAQAGAPARPPRGERPPRPERPQRPVGPPVEFSSADVSDTFAGVLSGDFDVDPEIVDGGLPAIPAKRVLAAEPDAPKLHKVLAQSGIGSRRDMEQLITDGKVTVNGEVAHTGQRISFGDEVRVAGRVVKLRIAPPPARVIAYHKPAGEVVTMDDPQQRPTVFRRLPRLQHGKWQSVGRLDINTEGLLLFTNSGDLANKLMHPRFGVEREYAVRVLGTLDLESRDKLLAGVTIEGQPAQFKSIEDGGGEGANRWYRVVITEGRNREVRKLFDAVGMAVSRLIRIRYGSVVLPKGLRRAVWVDLDENDVRRLRQLAGNDGANAPRGAAPREDGPRENAPREAREPREQRVPREQREGGAPQRENAPRNNNAPRNERGPRANQGQNGGQPPKGRDRNARGRDRAERRPDQAGSPAPFREPGDPSFIPNPLQQTFDRRAIQQRERPLTVADDFDEDGPIGPIPNPLQQTYDKRGVQGNRNAFGAGGGKGGRKGGGAGGGGGQPKQPDPLQTAVGYIGADTFHKKMNNRGGGGGRGRR